MENLRVEIYRESDGAKVGMFLIPEWVDDKWLERNMPPLFHGIRVLADAMIRQDKGG